MKLLRTTAFTAALMTSAVMSLTSPAQAQARLAWWGWPGLVAGYGYGYGTGFGYAANSYAPAYTGYSYPAYGYPAYGYPASRYSSSYGGYGMWENPWYSAAYHPFIRRHIPLWARAAGVRRHWQ